MKKTALFSALALTTSVFSDGDMIAGQMKPCPQSHKNNQQSVPMMNMVTLMSANPMSDNGWYIFVSPTYWHASVGNNDWAYKNQNVASSSPTFSMYKLDFKWAWGFKVGLGVNMDHDQWDSDIYYTWFRTRNSSAIGATDTQENFITHDLLNNGFPLGIREHKISFNMIDWELGRAHFVSKSLALRPHIGLKGGWINQDVSQATEYSTSSSSLKITNDFWGIGTSGGVNTSWMLGNLDSHRFSLMGDFAGALMYGHFDNAYKIDALANATATTTTTTIRSLNRNLAVPMLQAMLALGWDTEFYDNQCHFGFKVGYEFQYWFRQNQMLAVSGNTGFIRLSDDLSLQGLTIDFRFDF